MKTYIFLFITVMYLLGRGYKYVPDEMWWIIIPAIAFSVFYMMAKYLEDNYEA